MRSIVLVNVTQLLDAEALGACPQEKPVNYIVRGGDHLKFLVEQCGGTDSLEARRKLFSDDELQRWYNLEVNAGEKAGCLLPPAHIVYIIGLLCNVQQSQRYSFCKECCIYRSTESAPLQRLALFRYMLAQ